jgi:hypothetical protein
MAAISINDLQAGFDLISDQDSYLNELNDDEFLLVNGGSTPVCTVIATVVAFSASAAASLAITYSVKRVVDWVF